MESQFKIVQDLFLTENIDVVGVCPFESLSDKLINCRAKERLPNNAKSIITALFPYYLENEGERNLSRYACVEDYHIIVKNSLDYLCQKLGQLFSGEQFVSFVDNSPIPEVYAAAICGLGKIGDNGLLINERYGSFVFIGEIVTSKDFNINPKEIKKCLSCGACKNACPSYSLDSKENFENQCLSEITQKKGELTTDEEELIKKGGLVWGCDICQDVCPLNKKAIKGAFPPFKENPFYFLKEDDLKNPLENRAFLFKGEKPLLRNLRIINPNLENNT